MGQDNQGMGNRGRCVPLLLCDDILIIVYAQSTNLLATFVGHSDFVKCIATSENDNDRLIYSGSSDCTIRVFEYESRKTRHIMRGHRRAVEDLKHVVDTEKTWIYSASSDCTVRKWDTDTGDCVLDIALHASSIYQFLIDDDGILSGMLTFCNSESGFQLLIYFALVSADKTMIKYDFEVSISGSSFYESFAIRSDLLKDPE